MKSLKMSVIVVMFLMFISLSFGHGEYRLLRGWNIIGGANYALPSSFIEDAGDIIPPVFGYDTGDGVYVEVDSLRTLIGYWVLARDSMIIPVIDSEPEAAAGYNLSRGWNLIGGSAEIMSSSFFEDVEEIIPPVYRYDPSDGVYLAVDSLRYLTGYWVLSREDVFISLPDTLPDAVCPQVTMDIDGNFYETVVIGSQCWMAENLRTTRYRDSTLIPNITSNTEWARTTLGAYCEYYSEDFPDRTVNADVYGLIYNWYAVDDERGLCPEGWRVPSDEDFMELEMYLGMSRSEAEETGVWRGTDQGSQIAGGYDLWSEGVLRDDPTFGTSGFMTLPGGYRNTDGNHYGMTSIARIWVSTVHSAAGRWNRTIRNNSTAIYRNPSVSRFGFSVRCLLDE